MSVSTDTADGSFDLDSGAKGTAATFGDGERPDVDALSSGLWASNGAMFAIWTLPGTPTAAACKALSNNLWTSLVKLQPELKGPTVCVRTSEERIAAFKVRPVDTATGEGSPTTVYLDFTVWKKPGD
jgi:hypothetical protein